MSVNKYDSTTGTLTTLASGDRTWIGTRAQYDAQKQTGTLPNNCLIIITDDEEELAQAVIEDDPRAVTSGAVYNTLHTPVRGNISVKSDSSAKPTFYTKEAYQIGNIVYLYVSFTAYTYTAEQAISLEVTGVDLPQSTVVDGVRAAQVNYGTELWNMYKSGFGMISSSGLTIKIPEAGTYAVGATITYIVR